MPLPLFTVIIHSHNRREALSKQEHKDAIVAAAVFLHVGNASARISRLWREKIVGDVNRTLSLLAQDDDTFKDALPSLFGNEFAKWSKDYVDQVRTMRSTLPKNKGKRLLFGSAPPPPPLEGGGWQTRGGGPQFRGRGNQERFQGSKVHSKTYCTHLTSLNVYMFRYQFKVCCGNVEESGG